MITTQTKSDYSQLVQDNLTKLINEYSKLKHINDFYRNFELNRQRLEFHEISKLEKNKQFHSYEEQWLDFLNNSQLLAIAEITYVLKHIYKNLSDSGQKLWSDYLIQNIKDWHVIDALPIISTELTEKILSDYLNSSNAKVYSREHLKLIQRYLTVECRKSKDLDTTILKEWIRIKSDYINFKEIKTKTYQQYNELTKLAIVLHNPCKESKVANFESLLQNIDETHSKFKGLNRNDMKSALNFYRDLLKNDKVENRYELCADWIINFKHWHYSDESLLRRISTTILKQLKSPETLIEVIRKWVNTPSINSLMVEILLSRIKDLKK